MSFRYIYHQSCGHRQTHTQIPVLTENKVVAKSLQRASQQSLAFWRKRTQWRLIVTRPGGPAALRRTVRYDTIEEFNVDSKAEYTA